MSDPTAPGDERRPPVRPPPGAGSKLGNQARENPGKYPHIQGNPNGRPRAPEALKGAFLGCLRYGLNEATARAIVGVSDTVVARWKQEVLPLNPDGDPADPDDAMTFAAQCELAKATPKLNVSKKLVERAEAGDMQAILFFARHRMREFSDRPQGVPSDMARQIRAFVAAADVAHVGVDDPNAIQSFEPPEDDDVATGE